MPQSRVLAAGWHQSPLRLNKHAQALSQTHWVIPMSTKAGRTFASKAAGRAEKYHLEKEPWPLFGRLLLSSSLWNPEWSRLSCLSGWKIHPVTDVPGVPAVENMHTPVSGLFWPLSTQTHVPSMDKSVSWKSFFCTLKWWTFFLEPLVACTGVVLLISLLRQLQNFPAHSGNKYLGRFSQNAPDLPKSITFSVPVLCSGMCRGATPSASLGLRNLLYSELAVLGWSRADTITSWHCASADIKGPWHILQIPADNLP